MARDLADWETPSAAQTDDAPAAPPAFDADGVVDDFINLAEWLRDREATAWAR